MAEMTRICAGERLSKQAEFYIREHIAEKFSLEKIAGALYINGNYLSRIFRKHTGTTLLAYHNRMRCEQARELLIHSDRSVSEIGEQVGFVSPAHFSHVFKKVEGCTPTEYRMTKSVQ